jgi:hypothetical protein
MKMHRLIVLPFAVAVLASLPPRAQAQSPAYSEASPTPAAGSATPSLPYPNRTYTRPTEKTKLRNYFVDAFGPYPLVGAAAVAGLNQAQSTPPEWGQGASGYGKRFVSNIAIATVATTTRYALAEAFREDTIYYRCECKGFFPRLSHALVSSVTARSGDDGHRVFSFPALVAPYAGTMTAVYGWYPGRYGWKDGFRMGNYVMLGYVGQNVALEFLYGPHSLLSRLHLHPGHDSQSSDPQSHQ